MELPTIWWDNKLYCGTTSYIGHYKLYSGTTNYMVELLTLWCKLQTIWCKLQTKWCNLKTIWCKLKNYRGTTEKLQTIVTFIGELFCWCNNHQRSNHKKKKLVAFWCFVVHFLASVANFFFFFLVRLLNLKNDALRKRFDGLKYDVKRCEEVVYDLTIRGLVVREEKTEWNIHMEPVYVLLLWDRYKKHFKKKKFW